MTDSPDETRKHLLYPHDVEAVWIDRQPGSGALDAVCGWSKNKYADYEYANDGRSDTRTTFYWKRGDETPYYLRDRERHQLHRDPDDRRSWRKLSEWNDGVGQSSRKQDNFEADVRRWVQTFCGYLDLNQYQTSRVHYIVEEDIDLGGFGGIPAEHVIIGTISLVVDAESDHDPSDWSPDDWIIYQDDFEQLMDDVSMEQGVLWTVRKRVHAEADSFSETTDD